MQLHIKLVLDASAPNIWLDKVRKPHKSKLAVVHDAKTSNDDPKTALQHQSQTLTPSSFHNKYLAHPDITLCGDELNLPKSAMNDFANTHLHGWLPTTMSH